MAKINVKDLCKRLIEKDYILNSTFWVVLFAAVVSFLLGVYFLYNENQFWYNICFNIFQALGISVLFTIISKSSFFINILSEILEEIVYSTGHIENRSDKKEIWYRVTECLFKDKVPGLHKEISETIEKTYIPTSDIYFYSNYRQIIKLEWIDESQDIMCSYDIFSFDLHVNDTKEFDLIRDNWIPKNRSSEAASREITSYKVNGVDRTRDITTSEVHDSEHEAIGNRCFNNSIKLSGHKKYSIEQRTKRIFKLSEDRCMGFRAKWLVNDMDVRVKFPRNISVRYIPRGTANNFNIVKNDADNLDIEYKGLILQNQGYILILEKN